MRLTFRNVFLAAIALAFACFAGCTEKKPVTAANSGLRPAGDNNDKASDDKGSGSADNETEAGNGQVKPPINLESGNGTKKPPVDKPAVPAGESYKVPAGGPKELVAYLDKLDKRLQALAAQMSDQAARLSQEAREVIFSDVKRLMAARTETAEKILASGDVDADARERAVSAKLDALNFQEQVGDPEASAERKKFIASLKDDDHPAIREIVLVHTMESELEKIDAESNPMELLAHVKQYLAVDAKQLTSDRFRLAYTVANTLMENQQVDAGMEMLTLIGETFAKSPEPDLVEAAHSMSQQAQMIGLQHASHQLQAGDEAAKERLLALAKSAIETDDVQMQPVMMVTQVAAELKADQPEVAQELSALATAGLQKLVSKENQELSTLVMATRLAGMLDPPDADVISKADELVLARVQKDVAAEGVTAKSLEQMLSEVAIQAEFSGDIELASKLYESILAATTKIEDAKAVESITKQIEAAQKRIGLIGKPLVVEGKLADGTKFDWALYAGKVVLIDFWATWCGPCLREVPNIKTNYENYHEQGFDVVGINLDDDIKTVTDFFAARGELPWTTVFSPDDAARGFDTPLAKQCGVTAIPFVVLVGKDGNVAAIHVRGEQLGEQLEKIFGPPPSSDVPETGIVPEVPPTDTPPSEETPAEEQPSEEAPPTDAPEGEAPPASETQPGGPAPPE